MEYTLAWGIAFITGTLLIVICVYPLRRFTVFRWYVAAMGVFWLLVPWRFGDGLAAPLYVVFGFRTFLERDVDPSSVLTFGVLGSAVITTGWLIVLALRAVNKSKSKYKDIEF